ncbi:hypothetical protein DPMN_186600 [Dreissena polymorpha]|uniref:Uncharacterized protein n=1 Tax=Dreissena polymorpha TaxID=45954 RepID=A0A9D4I9Q3_DREPO|nr:hypothetical protein DPMN_186600 [Dreissena polymorpha]
MPPRKRRTKAPRAEKDAQVEEQSESPCLPQHHQENPTALVDPPLTNEEQEAEGGAGARKITTPRVITNFTEEENELIIDFLQQNPIIFVAAFPGKKCITVPLLLPSSFREPWTNPQGH